MNLISGDSAADREESVIPDTSDLEARPTPRRRAATAPTRARRTRPPKRKAGMILDIYLLNVRLRQKQLTEYT